MSNPICCLNIVAVSIFVSATLASFVHYSVFTTSPKTYAPINRIEDKMKYTGSDHKAMDHYGESIRKRPETIFKSH